MSPPARQTVHDAGATLHTLSFEVSEGEGDASASGRERSSTTAGFRLKEVIGEGGMGLVYLAEQQLPRRDVVIKRIRVESDHNPAHLVHEAMLTGSLEHPNIVPVHLLSLDDPSCPEVVMKYIQGRTLEQMCRAGGLREEALRECLGHLIQICHALEYAHSRGVVHRDVKPANIMVGDFGEVYLLDWGIGVELSGTAGPPRVVGTPAYMAPEMVNGRVEEVSVQTDVYLLGATLHQLLTGEPRHRAPTVRASLRSAELSEPAMYPAEVSEELAALCNAACAAEPVDRPPSVAAFRQALEHHLEHWQAMKLVRVAQAEKASLYDALERGSGPGELQVQVDRVSFAFAQALQIWPDCPPAVEGQRAVQRRLLEHHLERAELAQVEDLWQRLRGEAPDLRPQVEALRRAQVHAALESERLQEIGADHDPSVNRGPRRTLAIVISVYCLLFVLMLLSPVGARGFEDAGVLFGVTAALFGPMVMAIWGLQRHLVVNVHGRRAVLAVTSAMCGIVLHRGLAWHYGHSPLSTIVVDLLLIALATVNASPALRSGPLVAAMALLFIPPCVVWPGVIPPAGVLISCLMGGSVLVEWVFLGPAARPRGSS